MKKSFNMNDKNLLITSYFFYSNLEAMTEKNVLSELWFANHYIHLLALLDNTGLYLFFSGQVFKRGNLLKSIAPYEQCPFIGTHKMAIEPDKTIMDKDMLSFIKYNIDRKRAAHISVDRYYLNTYGYHAKGNLHQILIYGYDEEHKQFIFADNFSNGKYRIDLTCSYQELEDSYYKRTCYDGGDFDWNAYVLSQKECSRYYLDVKRIYLSFQEYLNPTLYFADNSNIPHYYYSPLSKRFSEFKDYKFGKNNIDIYEHFIYAFSNYLPAVTYIDIRCFCVLHDHKRLMKKRMEILFRYNFISDGRILYLADLLAEKSFILRNYILKYNTLYYDTLVEKLITLIQEIKTIEIEMLSLAIEDMRKIIHKVTTWEVTL